jgi:beta-1,4-mannooligosaccharide/beta-1,4-mannosyl-N-acetylglucosamine phosphorylase
MSEEQEMTAPALYRHSGNPVLTADEVPYPSVLVFNAGVTKWRGRYVMVFRNDYELRDGVWPQKTNLGLATSDDGVRWEVAPEPCFALESDEFRRAYDPRLTVIEDRCYVCFAVDTAHGIRGGLAVTDDLERFEVLSLSAPDNRNMVLFPERPGGMFMRLERPFPIYGRGAPEAFDMWLSRSPDGRHWGGAELVLGSEQVPYCNSKIGPAAPPVRTEAGWLALFHAVQKDPERELPSWHGGWHKLYVAGAALLDLEEPWRVIGISPEPVLVPSPEVEYEWQGFRGGVVFPCGLIAEGDGEAKIYYGAADTVVALATARLDDLVALCTHVPGGRGGG